MGKKVTKKAVKKKVVRAKATPGIELSTFQLLPETILLSDMLKRYDQAFTVHIPDFKDFKEALISLIRDNPSYSLRYVQELTERVRLIESILLSDKLEEVNNALREGRNLE